MFAGTTARSIVRVGPHPTGPSTNNPDSHANDSCATNISQEFQSLWIPLRLGVRSRNDQTTNCRSRHQTQFFEFDDLEPLFSDQEEIQPQTTTRSLLPSPTGTSAPLLSYPSLTDTLNNFPMFSSELEAQ